MKKFLTISIFLFITIAGHSQQRFLRYTQDSVIQSNFLFGLTHMANTSDSGFILSGSVNNKGTLLKMDRFGNKEWYNDYSGTFSFFWTEQTSDQGYITLGMNSAGKLLIMKTNSSGTVQWTKMKSVNSFNSDGYIHQLPWGGYQFACQEPTSPTLIVGRADASGNIIWEKSYGLLLETFGHDFAQATPDGGMVACGSFPSSGGLCLMKIDSTGSITWQRGLRPSAHGYSIKAIGTGFFITGEDGINHFAIKADATGLLLWGREWPVNFISSQPEYPFRVVADGDDYICYGTRFLGSQTATLIIRFDDQGNTMWSRYYGTNLTNNNNSDLFVRQTASSDLAFCKIDNLGHGTFIFRTDSNGLANCNDSSATFSPTSFVVVYVAMVVAPQTLTNTYTSPVCVATPRGLINTHVCAPLAINETQNTDFNFYPNPANEKITLQFSSAMESGNFSILDISGRVVFESQLESGADKIDVNVSGISAGFYVWKYEGNGKMQTGKFCIEH